MSQATVRLAGQGPASEDYTLTVDGHDVTHTITGIELRIQAQQPPTLVLHPLVFEADTGGDADVVIPMDTRDLLVRLGWTPPPQG